MPNIRNAASATVGAIGSIFGLFFMILNAFGGIIAGIWLAILGEWSLIITGLVAAVAMPFIFSIVNLPAMGLTAIVVWASNRGHRLIVGLVGFVSVIYSNLLVIIWTFGVFIYFTGYIGTDNPWPFLLWSYSTVMGPLGYMAKGESADSTATTIGLLLAAVCSVILIVGYFFAGLWIFIVPALMILGFSIIQAIIAGVTSPKKEQIVDSTI